MSIQYIEEETSVSFFFFQVGIISFFRNTALVLQKPLFYYLKIIFILNHSFSPSEKNTSVKQTHTHIYIEKKLLKNDVDRFGTP